jgi:hypothetical protein
VTLRMHQQARDQQRLLHHLSVHDRFRSKEES